MADPIVDLPGEIWKPVVGYEGVYEVSNRGRVKSLTRVVPHRNRWGESTITVLTRLLRPSPMRNGRLRVSLHAPGTMRPRTVHQLVLEAFVGPKPEGFECCHADDDPTNNRLENLRWDTQCANAADRIRNGGYPRGTRHRDAVLTEASVRDIRASDKPGVILAAKYGVTPGAIYAIRHRRSWRHI